jgi:hypothetical protein
MSVETCCGCKQLKSGVRLCAEDRLCKECENKNERNLAATRNASVCEKSIKTRAATAASASTEPKKDKVICPSCVLTVGNDTRLIDCDICRQTYHQHCTQMSSRVYDKFITNISVTGWSCETCVQCARTSLHRLQAAISQMAEEFATIKVELNDVKANARIIHEAERLNWSTLHQRPAVDTLGLVTATNADTDTSADRVTLIVHKTLNNNARRKRNVVVSGIPETGSAANDRIEFLRICERNLSTKPAIGDDSCKRLGNEKTTGGRRLLVRLGSEDAATQLLQAAPQLRQSDEKHIADNVYINADLSPAAAKLAYEARKLRRDTKQQQRHPHYGQRPQQDHPSHHNNLLSSREGVGVSGVVSDDAAAVTAESAESADKIAISDQRCIGVNYSGQRVSVVLNPSAPPFQSS